MKEALLLLQVTVKVAQNFWPVLVMGAAAWAFLAYQERQAGK